MSFEDLIQLPIFERKQSIRKKVFKGFWMTTKENFKIVKRIENKNAKKELDKKKKEGIISQALAKARKTKALKKGKAKKNVKTRKPYGFMQSSFWVIMMVHVMVCGDL